MKTARISIPIVFGISALAIYAAWFLVDSTVSPWLLTGTIIVAQLTAGLLFFWAQSTITAERKYTQEKLNLQRTITFNVSKVGELAINDFPFGIIMYQDQTGYPIRWVNRFIEAALPMSLFDQSVAVIDLSIVSFLEQGYASFELKLPTKEGTKWFQFINQTEHNVLFVTDLSPIRIAEQMLMDQRQMIGYLSIENLDDTIQSLTIQDSVNLQGKFYNTILQWGEENKVYVRGLTTERFILIGRVADLDRIIETEFAILEAVRQVAKNERIELSASIGVAAGLQSSEELSELAAEALDLANKRGGDQAVIMMEHEAVRYIGGSSTSVAKRSRVKSRLIANRLRQAISEAEAVLIMTHERPDHDAFGAVVGITNLVFSVKSDVHWYIDADGMEQDVRAFYDQLKTMKKTVDSRLCGIKELVDVTDLNPKNPLIIIVDVNNQRIVYGLKDHADQLKGTIAIIDHHRQGGVEIDAQINYIEPYASSTSEIVCELLQYFEDEIDLTTEEATLMLAGIVIDTNHFSVATTSRTFDAASYLKNNGANLQELQKNLREDYETLIQRSRLLANTQRWFKYFGVVLTDEPLSAKDRAKLAESILTINNFDASFVISRDLDGVNFGMSARSLGDVNVQLIAEQLGGGGHLTSSGTSFKDKSIDAIEDKLRPVLEAVKVQ
jgi:c-di-AMP phosphodiesterase-like protein